MPFLKFKEGSTGFLKISRKNQYYLFPDDRQLFNYTVGKKKVNNTPRF